MDQLTPLRGLRGPGFICGAAAVPEPLLDAGRHEALHGASVGGDYSLIRREEMYEYAS
jgi:hypothetical protein